MLSLMPEFSEHLFGHKRSSLETCDSRKLRDKLIASLTRFFGASLSGNVNDRNRHNLTQLARDLVVALGETLRANNQITWRRYEHIDELEITDVADFLLDLVDALGWHA